MVHLYTNLGQLLSFNSVKDMITQGVVSIKISTKGNENSQFVTITIQNTKNYQPKNSYSKDFTQDDIVNDVIKYHLRNAMSEFGYKLLKDY